MNGRDMHYPLRLLLPLLLLAVTVALAAYNLYRSVTEGDTHAEQHALDDLATFMPVVQKNIRYALARGETERAQESIGALGADAHIQTAFVLDDNDVVVAALPAGMRGQRLTAVLPDSGPVSSETLAGILARVRQTRVPWVQITPDRRAAIGIYPLTYTSAETPPRTATGILYVRRDLEVEKSTLRREAGQHVTQYTLALAGLAAVLLVLSHFVVTRRVGRLLTATRQFAAGDLQARSRVTGGDELGAIGRAFDGMAREIERDRQLLKASQNSLAEAQRIARLGNWEWDTAGGTLKWSDEVYRIFGLTAGSLQPTLDTFLELVHPDDRASVRHAIDEALQGRRPYSVDHRICLPDGTERIVHGQAEIVAGADGRPSVMLGTIQDITERRRAEEALRILAEASPLDSSQDFLRLCVRALARAFGVDSAFACVFTDARHDAMRSIALWTGDGFAGDFTFDLEGSACRDTLEMNTLFVSSGARRRYPDDRLLTRLTAESFFGITLRSPSQGVLGVVGVTDSRALRLNPWTENLLGVYANRMALELEHTATVAELENYRHHLEELVRERTNDLSALNKELQAFSYSVSHDLRAPLRRIHGFGQALLEDYAGQLDATGRDYLQRILAASEQMSELIHDLLTLSRVTVSEMKIVRTDLSRLAGEILRELQQGSPERRVAVHIAPDIVLHGDPRLLRVALENLLANAWKFTRGNRAARIEFNWTEQDGKRVCYVRDNGAGFDMHYADKLFIPFQRLHKDSEFEGTGIGLATVQRIIQRHGGKVWAEGRPGEGATFYFTVGEAGGRA